jgi:hypothetical protein
LVGFGLRQYLEGSGARLLWPWMLVSIFGLCGTTRLGYVGVFEAPEMAIAAFHLILAAVALAYGIGQLLYAFWPELFEDDTPLPRLTRDEVDAVAAAPASEVGA